MVYKVYTYIWLGFKPIENIDLLTINQINQFVIRVINQLRKRTGQSNGAQLVVVWNWAAG